MFLRGQLHARSPIGNTLIRGGIVHEPQDDFKGQLEVVPGGVVLFDMNLKMVLRDRLYARCMKLSCVPNVFLMCS